MNFPDTELSLPALTEHDMIDLDFVAHNADIILYSFVQDANDVSQLQKALAERLDSPQNHHRRQSGNPTRHQQLAGNHRAGRRAATISRADCARRFSRRNWDTSA